MPIKPFKKSIHPSNTYVGVANFTVGRDMKSIRAHIAKPDGAPVPSSVLDIPLTKPDYDSIDSSLGVTEPQIYANCLRILTNHLDKYTNWDMKYAPVCHYADYRTKF